MKINEIINEDVWHGSPHMFAPDPSNKLGKFRTDQIGTGEGNQAYGHGLYFASAKEIAEWYRKQLSDPHWKYKNIRINDLHGLNNVYSGYDGYPDERKVAGYVISYAKSKVTATTIGMALKNIDKAIDQVSSKKYNAPQSLVDRFKKDDQELITKYQMVADMIKKMDTKHFQYHGGYLYHVEIPEDSEYLDWDLKLSLQSDDIKSKLNPVIDLLQPIIDKKNAEREKMNSDHPGRLNHPILGNIASKELSIGDFKGEKIYEMLSIKLGNQIKASEYLHSLGIAGIKYIGERYRNYVVFDDSKINIKKRT